MFIYVHKCIFTNIPCFCDCLFLFYPLIQGGLSGQHEVQDTGHMATPNGHDDIHGDDVHFNKFLIIFIP